MKDYNKTKKQLVEEIKQLRRQITKSRDLDNVDNSAINTKIDSEGKYNRIIESSPLGIHMYCLESDNKLIFRGANPAADKILGVENKQFIGKTIEEAFPPLVDSEIPHKYRQAAKMGSVYLWRPKTNWIRCCGMGEEG